MNKLHDWGFRQPDVMEKRVDITGVIDFMHEWDVKRKSLPFDTDGICQSVRVVDGEYVLSLINFHPEPMAGHVPYFIALQSHFGVIVSPLMVGFAQIVFFFKIRVFYIISA